MTTEDDFQAALDANPEDWQTRLVFADWLQDRDDPRAEGYRALGKNRTASYGNFTKPVRWVFWCAESYGAPFPPDSKFGTADFGAMLPKDWFNQIGRPLQKNFKRFPTRREAEDAAALAFAKLPAERRAGLLNTEVTA